MASPIPSTAEQQAARERPVFAEIRRAPRNLALDYGFNNNTDGADPTLKGLYKLYGASQPKDGGDVAEVALRNITMVEIPALVALVRECAVPFNKLPVTSDFGGSLVFTVDSKSKNAHIAELYAVAADKVAISLPAIAAILTNRDQNSVPGRIPGRREQLPARDAQGNRIGRLGVADGTPSAVASAAPAGSAMQNLLRGVSASAAPTAVVAPSLEEASAGSPF